MRVRRTLGWNYSGTGTGCCSVQYDMRPPEVLNPLDKVRVTDQLGQRNEGSRAHPGSPDLRPPIRSHRSRLGFITRHSSHSYLSPILSLLSIYK
jgi:hypothetical protein